jgi:hypothetical protein
MRKKALVPGAPNAKQHPKEPMRCLKKEISGLCVTRQGGELDQADTFVLVVDQSGRVRPIIPGSHLLRQHSMHLSLSRHLNHPLQSPRTTIFNTAVINVVERW